MNGILLVDKPEGMTSAAVVREVKRSLRCKVGHLGTLDPFASGLLPLCLGDGTKIAQFLNAADKSYEGVLRLGARTDTGDRTGTVIERKPLPPDLRPERCRLLAAGFTGERLQVPPMYSALKREGVPLYKLARQGIEVERQPRRVTIHSLELSPIDGERLALRLHCSKGTYVRVLAEEIGEALGSAAHLETLRRTSFGRFHIDAAVRLPIEAAAAVAALIPPREALGELEEVRVDRDTAARIARGQQAALRGLARPRPGEGPVKLIGPDATLLAVICADASGTWQFARVLV
jgi:tRNA pseudouridine55 synthase